VARLRQALCTLEAAGGRDGVRDRAAFTNAAADLGFGHAKRRPFMRWRSGT